MNHLKVVTTIAIFVLGCLAVSSYQAFSLGDEQLPYGHAGERASPGDWLTESQLRLRSDMLFIEAEGITITRFADTNSMDPTLDLGANGIEIALDEEDRERLQPGDIISYKQEGSDNILIHRIARMGQDSQGTYYIVKGDNNLLQDPGKVRFEHIQGVVIGILY